MSKTRLEAFSDGVIAIIITIMVLELRPPHGISPRDLLPLGPTFFSYALSFGVLGTYWNNHHHTMQVAKTVSAWALWANLHLLFWLSMFPLATAWMGEHNFAPFPVAAYGVVQLFCALAYFGFLRALIAAPGQTPALADAVGKDLKGKISPALFAIATPIALVAPAISVAIYASVLLLWIVPDPRMERMFRR
jgi:uncharacterized membrane protein